MYKSLKSILIYSKAVFTLQKLYIIQGCHITITISYLICIIENKIILNILHTNDQFYSNFWLSIIIFAAILMLITIEARFYLLVIEKNVDEGIKS